MNHLNANAYAARPDRSAMTREEAAIWFLDEVAAVSRLAHGEAKINRMLELAEMAEEWRVVRHA